MKFLLFATLMLLSACATMNEHKTQPSELSSVLQRQWVLQKMTDHSKPLENLSSITLSLDEQRLSGFSGCNRYFAAYQGGPGVLTLTGPIGATRKACADDIERIEQQYLELLAQVTGYELVNHALTLTNKEGENLLVFQELDQNKVLQQGNWQASAISYGEQGIVSDLNTHLSFLRFKESEVSGNAACNQFSANYELKGQHIQIHTIKVSNMECGDMDVMKQEYHFLKALELTRTLELEPEALVLKDEAGRIKLQFHPQ